MLICGLKKECFHENRPTDIEAKNAVALFTQFVVAIKGLVLSVFFARNLGAVVFGKNSFAFTAIFAVSSSSDIARCRSEKLRGLNH